MDFLSVHLLVGYAFFNLSLFFQKSSKFFMRELTHKTSQVLTSVVWILKNDLDIQLALGQGMNNLPTRLFENRVEMRPNYAVSRYPTKTYWSIGHFDAKWYSTFSLPCKICSFHPTRLFLNHKPFFHFLLRSFAKRLFFTFMIVVTTQICKRTYHRHGGTSDLPFDLNSFLNKSIVSRLRNFNFCVVLVTLMEVS